MTHTTELHPTATSPGLEPWRHNVNSMRTALQVTFQHILFATDFSATADRALPYAVEIARRSAATIHALHVIPPAIYPSASPEEWSDIAQQEEEFRARKKDELELELQELPHELLLIKGDVWETVQEIIEYRDVDLIVMGTRGRTGVAKALLGSTAEKIFRQVSCPVLTIGPAAAAKSSHANAADLNCILYRADFTPESRYAISLAKEHHAELVLIHAIESSQPGQINLASEILRNVVPFGAGLPSEPQCLVERGCAVDVILNVAARKHADLIVLGVRSPEEHIALATHVAASTAYSVITKAACPVLTVRG